MISDELLLQWIRTCISEGRFHFTQHALTHHPMAEGFTARQVLEAIEHGSIIERRDAEGRCLVCGKAAGLAVEPAFITTYLHCVVQWDDERQVVIITMYRPKSAEWQNPFTRR